MKIAFDTGHLTLIGGGLPVLLFLAAFAALLIIVTIVVALRQRGKKPVSGIDELIGMEGLARTDLAPMGTVFIRSELWRAQALGATIDKGNQVVVRRVQGLTLFVDKAQKEDER
jgi:membrane-bound serine protease (ClpP class)